eukprot:4823378-Prymnesium_polylepis.1
MASTVRLTPTIDQHGSSVYISASNRRSAGPSMSCGSAARRARHRCSALLCGHCRSRSTAIRGRLNICIS